MLQRSLNRLALFVLLCASPMAQAQEFNIVLPGHVFSAASATLSYVTHTTGTTEVCTAPATIEAGDLLVGFAAVYGTSNGKATNIGLPTGWTAQIFEVEITGGTTDDTAIGGYYKIAAGTEDGASVDFGTAADDTGCMIFQYRLSSGAIASLSLSTPVTEGTTGNPAQQTIAASAGTPPVLAFGVYACGSCTLDPRTSSFTANHEVSVVTGSLDFYVKDYVQNTAPADVTVDMDDENVQDLASFYIHNFAN